MTRIHGTQALIVGALSAFALVGCGSGGSSSSSTAGSTGSVASTASTGSTASSSGHSSSSSSSSGHSSSSSSSSAASTASTSSGSTSTGSNSSSSSGSVSSSSGSVSGSSSGSGATYSVILLHTNDVHGHMEGHEPELDYDPTQTGDGTRGGIARIAAQVKTERAAATANQSVILLDSGDFTQGTAFSSYLATTESTELYEMCQMGYDAMTLGNHEFDFTSAGTAAIIEVAATRGASPKLVATNIQIPTDGGAPELAGIAQAGLLPSFRTETLPNGLTVGYVGIMGANAASVAPLAAPVTFNTTDLWLAVQPTVQYLRQDAGVDMVVALSHSGTDESGIGEDANWAAESSGVDIIVSGHTHVALATPVSVTNAAGNPVYIVQTGSYGLNLGKMTFDYTVGSGISNMTYDLEPIDDSIIGDVAVQARVTQYVTDINNLFTDAGAPFQYFSPLGHTAFDLPNTAFVETGLGDLVTDAYRTIANAVTLPDAGPVTIAVESNGNLRAPLVAGKTGVIAWADLFNVTPLGIGPDELPGYPLATYYLSGKDLKSGLELSAAASNPAYAQLGLYDNDYFLQLSGVDVTYNPAGVLFTSLVTSATVNGTAVDFTNTTNCYRVVSTYYLEELLSLVNSATAGALTVTPKQADCATALGPETFSTTIVYGPGATEVKNWEAVAEYVGGMPTPTDGGLLPELNAAYAAPQGRITGL